MSVCVTVRTKSVPEPKAVFKELADTGEQIVVTSGEYPCLKLGRHLKALRGIEINKEDDGVEVRVCSFASADDYRLFAKAIAVLQKLTGGTAYGEDEDDSPIADPTMTFGDEWMEGQREADFRVNRALSYHYGEPVIMDGIFMAICLGAKMFSEFGFSTSGEYEKAKMDELQDYLSWLQWRLADKENTATRMLLPDPVNADSKPLSISLICIKDGKVNDFDYISYADLLAIMDMDNKDSAPVLIPFGETWKVVTDDFRLIDERQFERTAELTADSVRDMMCRARKYQLDNLHHRPLAPGHGYDEGQNTFILTWNPAISSVTLQDHKNSLLNMATEYFNWSIREHDKAKCGDRFFLVRGGMATRASL